jgi:hypothetical protein
MDYGYGGGGGEMDVGMVMAVARQWISSDVMWCWRLSLLAIVTHSLSLSLLLHLGVELYRGPFTKVARVDLAEAVVPNTCGHTGRLCPYR